MVFLISITQKRIFPTRYNGRVSRVRIFFFVFFFGETRNNEFSCARFRLVCVYVYVKRGRIVFISTGALYFR